jgi:putative type I restriction enzyme specificity protein HI_0216
MILMENMSHGQLMEHMQVQYSIEMKNFQLLIFGLISPKNSEYLLAKFISYWLQIEAKKHVKGGSGNPKLMSNVVSDIFIPIPSRETQEKIVKKLDEFTNCVTELQTKLQAELKARIKQYSYHRDMLLSEKYLNKISEKIDGLENKGYKIRFTTLGEIGEIQMCKRILKEQTLSQGDIPFYKIGTFGKKADSFISKELFREYREKYNYPKKGEILISASGTIGKTVIFDGKDVYFQDSNIVWISHNEEIALNKYLYYFYQVINWNPSTGGTINRLYNYNLKNVKVVLPPLELQNKVVEILDKFQSLIADTKGLLPKEIEERKKQYEYYREKLLSFKR